MKRDHAARYDLALLGVLLRDLGPTLAAAGVAGPEAEALAMEARDFAARVLALRQETAARVTTCASS